MKIKTTQTAQNPHVAIAVPKVTTNINVLMSKVIGKTFFHSGKSLSMTMVSPSEEDTTTWLITMEAMALSIH